MASLISPELRAKRSTSLPLMYSRKKYISAHTAIPSQKIVAGVLGIALNLGGHEPLI